jgi:hypothetical protein
MTSKPWLQLNQQKISNPPNQSRRLLAAFLYKTRLLQMKPILLN